jgi:hypothetical protein
MKSLFLNFVSWHSKVIFIADVKVEPFVFDNMEFGVFVYIPPSGDLGGRMLVRDF